MSPRARNEYDIQEEFEPEPDTGYVEMIGVLEKEGYDLATKSFLSLPEGERRQLLKHLIRHTSASRRQASRFLHLPPAKGVKAPDPFPALPWFGFPEAGDVPF